ncbi:MAG: type II toxin-antitoxin system VapC family toxin [Candidatus Polarisedimenticolaceae bacterium]|nr:type II toxin-antitoxin system VapC family toxin [Candidatus Polarisedimenticolaceae bacterium]
MKYLLDTCVISEAIKPKPNKKVVAWLKKQDEESLYLSVLTFGEIEKGIEKSVDGRRKNKLRMWVEEDLKQRFEGRILPIDMQVASKWGEIQGKSEAVGKPLPSIDGLIAVTGLVNNCVVVTRNVSDMQQSSVELHNPWGENA